MSVTLLTVTYAAGQLVLPDVIANLPNGNPSSLPKCHNNSKYKGYNLYSASSWEVELYNGVSAGGTLLAHIGAPTGSSSLDVTLPQDQGQTMQGGLFAVTVSGSPTGFIRWVQI